MVERRLDSLAALSSVSARSDRHRVCLDRGLDHLGHLRFARGGSRQPPKPSFPNDHLSFYCSPRQVMRRSLDILPVRSEETDITQGSGW